MAMLLQSDSERAASTVGLKMHPSWALLLLGLLNLTALICIL